jgi:sugar phosphate isomerase/epimerase
MWRWHPTNNAPDAWRDLLGSMREAVAIAEEHNIIVAFEPEVTNVVDTASKARRLLDEIPSAHLKVVMDPANLFHEGELSRMGEILDEAFELLGDDIAIAHAKDVFRDGEAGRAAPGRGLLDYERYLHLLQGAHYDGALVLHGLDESQVDDSLSFVRSKLAVAMAGGSA